MVSQVEIVSKEIIKPSSPTPSLINLKLSFLDKLEGTNYGSILLFYENHTSPKLKRPQISHKLKQSLSETLTKFYPYAGRINGNNDSIDCNDSGALFVEAQVHSDLLQKIQSATKTDINQYLPINTSQSHQNYETNNFFPLAVQISFFRCGGVGIGVCLSHGVADMYTLATFVNSWAANCSGRTENFQPDFQIGNELFPLIEIPADQVPDPAAVHDFVAGEEKIVTKRLIFDVEILGEMKKQASSRSSSDNPTTVETISAFIWKHMIDAIRAKTATKKAFGAFHSVDIRRRISPPIPNAMGNFIVATLARCDSKDSGDFCDLVTPLREAIRKDYKEYIKNEQKILEYLGLLSKSEPERTCCLFTSICKFPLYEMEFGWGKPFAFFPMDQKIKNGVILMDTKSGDGIEAWISMAEDEMGMLPTQFLELENDAF